MLPLSPLTPEYPIGHQIDLLCDTKSANVSSRKKKRNKLTALSNKQTARSKSRASPKMNRIRLNAFHMRGWSRSTTPARNSSAAITNAASALINISTAKIKRKRNEPGAPVDCKLVGLFHRSCRNLDNNKAHPEARVCPDKARPGARMCPDEVPPGMCVCPNDTSHNMSTMLENTGCGLDDRWARGRHNEHY